MKTPKDIFTLGTSTRSLKEFFELLGAFDIDGVLDVRRFPKSSRYPHFNRESLEHEAEERGFSYRWLGEALGGFRSGGYDRYKQQESYLKGIEEVEHLARKYRMVLICAEKLPWKCHRLKIAQSLKERGWNVIHVIDRDRTWQPEPTLFEDG